MSEKKKRPLADLVTIHQCEFLEYESCYLELFYPGEAEYQRWALRYERQGYKNPDSDTVLMQMVCFCPGCGLDLRKDLLWRVVGRPGMNEMLDRIAKEACQ